MFSAQLAQNAQLHANLRSMHTAPHSAIGGSSAFTSQAFPPVVLSWVLARPSAQSQDLLRFGSMMLGLTPILRWLSLLSPTFLFPLQQQGNIPPTKSVVKTTLSQASDQAKVLPAQDNLCRGVQALKLSNAAANGGAPVAASSTRKRLTLSEKETAYFHVLDVKLQPKTATAFINSVYKTVDQCVYRERKRRETTPSCERPAAVQQS